MRIQGCRSGVVAISWHAHVRIMHPGWLHVNGSSNYADMSNALSLHVLSIALLVLGKWKLLSIMHVIDAHLSP